MLWKCPKLRYWQDIIININSTLGIEISLDPNLCLLNIMEEPNISKHTHTAMTRGLFQARKLIAQKWISIYPPPTVEEWRTQIKETIIKEEFIYTHGGSQDKFDAIWKSWVEAWDNRSVREAGQPIPGPFLLYSRHTSHYITCLPPSFLYPGWRSRLRALRVPDYWGRKTSPRYKARDIEGNINCRCAVRSVLPLVELHIRSPDVP